MKNRRNYYRVLQVQPGAPAAIIKASYRAMLQRLKLHPDLGGDHAQAALINEAFQALSDPARRAAYDRTLVDAVAAQRAGRKARTAATADARGEPAAPPATQRAPGAAEECAFCVAPVALTARDWADASCPRCGSALYPVQKHQHDDATRRAMRRVPRHMPLTFRRTTSGEQAWVSVTEDISLNGMGFVSPVALSAGERLSIDCGFCSAIAIVKSVRVDASVVHPEWQCGVEFLTLRLKQRRGGLYSTVA